MSVAMRRAQELAVSRLHVVSDVAADDQRAAGEALRLFITDTLAARSARVAALGRATPFQ
jgi:hypothetical protein